MDAIEIIKAGFKRLIKFRMGGVQAGGPADAALPGSYLTLDRQWSQGDQVTVRMPMSLRAHRMPDDPNVMALMYGPVVLSGISNEDLPEYLIGDSNNLSSWLTPVAGQPLHFSVAGQDTGITLLPLSKVIDQKYGVYWRIARQGSPECERLLAAKRAAAQTRTIDRIEPNSTSETDHNFTGANTSSGFAPQGAWRVSSSGGVVELGYESPACS